MSNSKQIGNVLARLDYGVHVVTMGEGETGNALTVSWLTQVSSDPPMVALAIKSSHQSARLVKEAGSFAVNFLAIHHESLAKTYYGPAESGYDKLKGSSLAKAPVTGSPLLSGAVGFLDCKIAQQLVAGDHTIFVGEVVAAELDKGAALLNTASSGMRYRG